MIKKLNVLLVIFVLILSFLKTAQSKNQSIIVTGTVINEVGESVVGAKVVAHGVPGVEDFTREAGEFALRFPLGLKGEKVTIMFSKEGYKPNFMDKYVIPESDTHLDHIKLQTLFIEGYLYRKTRDAIKGAIITVVEQPSLQDTTDSEGHFKIVSSDMTYHPPPGITIWIEINGRFYEDTCRMNVVNTTFLDLQPDSKSKVDKYRAREKEASETISKTAEVCTTYFRVTDTMDNALEHAKLMVDEIPSMLAYTDKRGKAILTFEADNVGKEFRIWIRKEGYESSYKELILQKGTMSLIEAKLEEVIHHLRPPRLKKPSDKTNISDATPTFEWECLDGCTFDLQVDEESDFLSPEINRVELIACHYISKEKLDFGTYYWRVRSREKASNNLSDWSRPWIVIIERPMLIAESMNVNKIFWRRSADNNKAAWRSLLIPGWGQVYKGHSKWEAVGFWVALGATTGLSILAHKEYRNHQDKYSGSLKVWEITEEYDQANKYYKLRNRLLYIGLPTIWIINVFHAYFSKDVVAEGGSYGEIRYDLTVREGHVRLAFTKLF
jgi:hypothetical protein